ncbi:hypothetical protein DLJ59_02035 [Micromonospora inaquosa]|uniref:Uncharacterized protein n=1 Tax=Micromonospora inaquosa TaxID=2203716 RepID=A0A3N9X4W5_9ACTN|nr:hypothetical protein DLJ59_02035 [Micromonospora inaquosa]
MGGAAMALAYDAKRVTRDVDAMFVPQESSSMRRVQWPTRWAYRRGGSTSRPACMYPARTTRASGGSSTTLACA